MSDKIDSDVPIPERFFRRGKGYSARLKRLEVGQSTVLDTSWPSACKLARDTLGRGRYTSREEVDGVRIWRVS